MAQEAFDIRHTKIWADLNTQAKAGREKSALITDIDNSWYRADNPAAAQAAWKVRKQASAASYPIIAVTGASYDALVRPRMNRGELPKPEILVSSVGTEIRFLMQSGIFQKDETYENRLESTGYNRLQIVRAACELLARLQTNGVEIDFQEPHRENEYLRTPSSNYLPYKVSLNFFAENTTGVAHEFARHFSDYKIVVCEEIHHNATLPSDAPRKRYCLDIVAANKADAANYLIQKLGIARGVVGGDSGNDIDLLIDTPKTFAAVAVGGHKVELKNSLEVYKAKHKNHKPIFVDTDDSRMGAQTLQLFDGYLKGERKDFAP